jgi:hypothetical protein
MPATQGAGRRLAGRLNTIGSELYVGTLVLAVVIVAGIMLVAGGSYLLDFTNWVALND